MRTWWWLLLTILTLVVGCAQGYYDRPAYREAPPAFSGTPMWWQNPETESQEGMRIWQEEAGR